MEDALGGKETRVGLKGRLEVKKVGVDFHLSSNKKI